MTIVIADAIAEELRRQIAEDSAQPQWDRLERRIGLSRRQIDRIFRLKFQTTPTRYFADMRAEVAAALLTAGHDVLNASLQAGFSSPGRLHDAMVSRRGMTPGEIRSEGRGVHIAYGFFDTPLGPAMLAATPRGLCALRLCRIGGPEKHLADLRKEFPQATTEEAPASVQHYADQLIAFLESRAATFDPAIDVHGTTFQREVWTELRKLPVGVTVTYTDIAARIGKPRAIRAVARACAANGLAIAIPCHRVKRMDGSLAGYRWGIEWKKKLLELEQHMKSEKSTRTKSTLDARERV